MPFYARVAIIGVGLIGASLARALKKHALCDTVAGCGRSRENLEFALESGYIDVIEQDHKKAVSDADLVVLSASPMISVELMELIAPALIKGAVVIDVGSVKGRMVESLSALVPDGVSFVPCHPIAGNERAGAVASVDDLFSGAACILCDAGAAPVEVFDDITALWRAIGSDVSVMDPFEHDSLLGLVSHFPHLAAYAMVNAIEDREGNAIGLSGGGLKDTTRIAMSPASLWRDICMMNRENITGVLGGYIDELTTIKSLLESGDAPGLEALLEKAQKRRQSIEG